MKTNQCASRGTISGRTRDTAEIKRRLHALDMGFHSNRLEGVLMSEAKLARVRDMVRQGMDLDEIRTIMTQEFRASAQSR